MTELRIYTTGQLVEIAENKEKVTIPFIYIDNNNNITVVYEDKGEIVSL